MLFIHPMWSHESQRIGKQKCTPTGYALHILAELIGFIGLLFLLAVLVLLVYRGVTGTFHISLLWLLTVPVGLGVVSEVSYQYSWYLALRKGFHFDDERSEASWTDAGERQTYKWPA
jgi:hypothetical protein